MDKELIEILPTRRIKAPGQKTVVERTFFADEFINIYKAFEAKGGVFGDLFELFLTGRRRAEVAAMGLDELCGREIVTLVGKSLQVAPRMAVLVSSIVTTGSTKYY
jgi:hypothetical protein